MKYFTHRPDCGCPDCVMKKSLRPQKSIPKAMSGHRMLLGFGQDETDDSYDASYDDEASEPAPEEAAAEPEPETEEAPEAEADTSETDDSGSGVDWASLLSSGLTMTSTAAQIAKATGVLPGAQKAGAVAQVLAPSGTPLTSKVTRPGAPLKAAASPQQQTMLLAAGALAVGAYFILMRKKA